MELIPILSTIILIATICTFILAVGAYILYKVREKKGQQTYVVQPALVEGELVVPAEIKDEIEKEKSHTEFTRVSPTKFSYEKRYKPEIVKEEDMYNFQRPKKIIKEEEKEIQKKQEIINKTKETNPKYYKYTSAGYVPAGEDKDTGKLKWR